MSNQFGAFTFFHRYLGYRIFLLAFASLLVALFDGLGIAMFIPILAFVAGGEAGESSALFDNLDFILTGFDFLGIELELISVLLAMLIVFLIKGFFQFVLNFLKVLYQQYFVAKLRIESIEGLSDYGYQYFVSADAGEIQNTLSGEVGRVVQGYRTYNALLQNLILVLSYATMAFLANAQFSLLVMIGGGLSNLFFQMFYKRTKNLSAALLKQSHAYHGLILQKVEYFKYLKSTGLIWQYSGKIKKKIRQVENSIRRMGFLSGLLEGAKEPLSMIVVVFAIVVELEFFGGVFSTILVSLLLFYRALGALTQVQAGYNNYLSFSGSLIGVQDFLRGLREHREDSGTKVVEQISTLELEKVSFAYPDKAPILENINLRIPGQQTLAIVGESGSGKTTLLNLISGLLQPSSGQLKINGFNSTELDIPSFQRRIGYISQEPVIFDDSLFHNVTFWAEKTPENLDRFHEALHKAHLMDLLHSLVDGEETRLGHNGVSLSGGQKQRISIARELYKEVDLLLMDEATSALDSETESVIQNNIDGLKGKLSIIIIAHRLSTIKNVDHVVLMEAGRIKSVGSYQDLLQDSEDFKRMVSYQQL